MNRDRSAKKTVILAASAMAAPPQVRCLCGQQPKFAIKRTADLEGIQEPWSPNHADQPWDASRSVSGAEHLHPDLITSARASVCQVLEHFHMVRIKLKNGTEALRCRTPAVNTGSRR